MTALKDVPMGVRLAMNKRSKGRCEICYISPGLHLHHRKRRREGDHSLPNVLHLCPNCHRRVHERPSASMEKGWILRFCEDDPSAVPVLYRGFWVMLTTTGESDQRTPGSSDAKSDTE